MTDHDAVQVRETELDAQLNLHVMLQLCADGELRCSKKTNRPSGATQRTLSSRLVHGDFYPDATIAAFAWPLLIKAGGLVRNVGGRLQSTAKGRRALHEPPADVLRTLWQRWISHGLIDEITRIEQLKGQRGRNVLTALQPRRALVAIALAGLPAGDWIMVDDLFATIRRQGLSPQVSRSVQARFRLHIAHPEYGSLGHSDMDSWPLVEGRYILALLFEYAAVLGLIDVTYRRPAGARRDLPDYGVMDGIEAVSRYDGLESIRINRLGSYGLG